VCQDVGVDQGLPGRLLVAAPLLSDPNFTRTVVLVLQHDEEGALGVVLNRPSEDDLGLHLPSWGPSACEPPFVFVGGPVEPSVAIGLEQAEAPPEPTALPGVGMLDFDRDPAAAGPVRVFSGYAGWGPGQLEDELAEGAWLVVAAEPDDPFTDDPDGLWAAVLRRQPGVLALLATFPPDPSLN
jgi:putative transcriptional regulator